MARMVGRPHRVAVNYGEPERVVLMVDRGLKSGKLDEVTLTERDLWELLTASSELLANAHAAPERSAAQHQEGTA